MREERKNFVIIAILVLLLAGFGCVMVYSASCYSAQYHFGNEYFFLFKQIFGVVLGCALMFILSFVDYHFLSKFVWIIYAGTIVLLVLVFIPGIGTSSYGASRWISILGFSIQPSEIAKFAFVLFASLYLSNNYKKAKSVIVNNFKLLFAQENLTGIRNSALQKCGPGEDS